MTHEMTVTQVTTAGSPTRHEVGAGTPEGTNRKMVASQHRVRHGKNTAALAAD